MCKRGLIKLVRAGSCNLTSQPEAACGISGGVTGVALLDCPPGPACFSCIKTAAQRAKCHYRPSHSGRIGAIRWLCASACIVNAHQPQPQLNTTLEFGHDYSAMAVHFARVIIHPLPYNLFRTTLNALVNILCPANFC